MIRPFVFFQSKFYLILRAFARIKVHHGHGGAFIQPNFRYKSKRDLLVRQRALRHIREERSEFFSADTVLLALQFLYALLQSALLRIERGNFRLYVIKIKAFSDR
ncbi:hypothetical protein [Eggerthella lenta]|uniref:Uncharacterized protein n=1 Tax=Eggerthella lenta TaxID=84112 RepID=A0ABD7GIL6_EGGLN|nr:hypothetical protein [Eggerthella lenta]RDC24732.1 hypothetical protein C1857_06855 [Eggerthella lenta]RDC36682.1 hypothetical protein C1852_09875 [Eggerthella lenta]RDC37665.1 hypothetical protein C1853_09435 [Eggerthella lenta]